MTKIKKRLVNRQPENRQTANKLKYKMSLKTHTDILIKIKKNSFGVKF